MSRTRLRVNPYSIVAWMSRNSLLEAGAKWLSVRLRTKWLWVRFQFQSISDVWQVSKYTFMPIYQLYWNTNEQMVGYFLSNGFWQIPASNKHLWRKPFWKLEIGKFWVQSFPPVSLLAWKVFIEKHQRNKRVVFSYHGPLKVI